jgi:hypothetical protein
MTTYYIDYGDNIDYARCSLHVNFVQFQIVSITILKAIDHKKYSGAQCRMSPHR